MGVSITLAPEFGYVVLAAISILIVNFYLGGKVGRARTTYGIKLPNLYAMPTEPNADAFNRVQRGHQNMIETEAGVYMMLFTNGVFYPQFAAICGLLIAVGRVIYAHGYAENTKSRIRGTIVFTPAVLLLAIGAGRIAYLLATGGSP
jgi:glutathione S-transferase